MGYVSKTNLRPNIISANGSDTISFTESPCIFKIEDVNFATEYFNPITGLFDNTKSILNFTSGTELLINQAYSVTAAELVALA
jgi:hypothetical protein